MFCCFYLLKIPKIQIHFSFRLIVSIGDLVLDAVQESHCEDRSSNRTKEHAESQEQIHSWKRKEKQREQILTYNAIQKTFYFVKGILKNLCALCSIQIHLKVDQLTSADPKYIHPE